MLNINGHSAGQLDKLGGDDLTVGPDAVLLGTTGGGMTLYARQSGGLRHLGDFDDPAAALNALDGL